MTPRLLLLFLCFFGFEQVNAQCSDEVLYLNSQADVDNFLVVYPDVINWNGSITISGSTTTNLNALANLESICGRFTIIGTSLTNLNGLNNLTTVDDDFGIASNDLLINLQGLENLSIVENFSITNNDALLNLNGLGDLTNVNYLQIFSNVSLINLEGFNYLGSYIEEIDIFSNANLTNVDGLTSLSEIGRLEIMGNNMLNSLQGLENLTSLEFLFIVDSPSLTNLVGLENLEILKAIFFRNTMLNSLDAIADVVIPDYNPSTDANSPIVLIEDCPFLSNCSIIAICEQISDSNFYFSIQNNASGCNSVPEILVGCQNLGIEDMTMNPVKIYPTIAEDIVTITGGDFSKIQIYDTMGRMVLEAKMNSKSINIEKLASGKYFIRLTDTNYNVVSKELFVR